MRLLSLATLGCLSLLCLDAGAATRPDRVARGQVKALNTAAAKIDRGAGPQTIKFKGGELRYTPGVGTTALFDNGAVANGSIHVVHLTPHAGAQLPTTHEGVAKLRRGDRSDPNRSPGSAPIATTQRRFKDATIVQTDRTFQDGSTSSLGSYSIGVPSHPLWGQTLTGLSQNGPQRATQPNQWSSSSKSTQYRGAGGRFGANGDSLSAVPVARP